MKTLDRSVVNVTWGDCTFFLNQSSETCLIPRYKTCFDSKYLFSTLIDVYFFHLQENRKNSENFPRRFSRGAPEGFWFAFISMTTVG